ncbi:MAG TPA: hypothetical protein VGH09_00300 [Solirubrobacteraceae bacterium]|jgi:hypothetical protein
MGLLDTFVVSFGLIAAGGFLFLGYRDLRAAGAALVGLGTLLLIIAVIEAANFNS